MNLEEVLKRELDIIKKGAYEIIGKKDLIEKINLSHKNNRPLEIKMGIDPSGPHIHLGHVVVLKKVRDLQNLGHNATIIIGDFTGKIGDPAGNVKRQISLSTIELMKNAENYKEQILKILDKERTKIVFNSNWLRDLDIDNIIDIAKKLPITNIIHKDLLSKWCRNKEITGVPQYLYPMIQGYDSVYLKADIEIGGYDQKANILIGRMLQQEMGYDVQSGILMPILEGIDGKRKMSKTYKNYIGIEESSESIVTKIMSMSNELIIPYFNMITNIDSHTISSYEKSIEENKNIKFIKLILAKEIIRLCKGSEGTATSYKEILKMGYTKENMREIILEDKKSDIVNIMIIARLVPNREGAKELIGGNQVKINGKDVINSNMVIHHGDIIAINEEKYVKIFYEEEN